MPNLPRKVSNCKLNGSRNIAGADIVFENLITDKVTVYLDVFGAFMKHWIFDNV